ncbi:MAG: ABC transporter ATP-binding protein [Thermoanaerobaculum sp.]|nr:ABC transporter ATP-binding protein [Thermoanaerobaculum sp.]MDW7967516.1 ABC transporter ATP-binding protein [Thermoanaerobaculum sp.]
MLEVRHLRFGYRAGEEVLSGVSLRVEEGEIFGLLGPNGSGKSTLLGCLTGFLRPWEGEVLVGGLELYRNPRQARQLMAYLPDTTLLWEQLTAGELVELFADLLQVARPAPRELASFGLPEEVWWQKVKSFSKGMRQRLALFLVTLRVPRVLLLDEPTTGLDPQGAEVFLRLVRSLAAQGTAVLVVTHDVFRLAPVCHRLGLLQAGQVVPYRLGEVAG